ncbi:MAG: hypothetical protein AAGM29_12015, partial [Cyanobacteria bacterium J06588_4]
MKLSLIPIKILLAFFWVFLATESVRSQTRNMSDITLPNPDSMITEPDPTPSEDVVGEETDAPVDDLVGE